MILGIPTFISYVRKKTFALKKYSDSSMISCLMSVAGAGPRYWVRMGTIAMLPTNWLYSRIWEWYACKSKIWIRQIWNIRNLYFAQLNDFFFNPALTGIVFALKDFLNLSRRKKTIVNQFLTLYASNVLNVLRIYLHFLLQI